MNDDKTVVIDTQMQIKMQEWMNTLRDRHEFSILKSIRNHARYLIGISNERWHSLDNTKQEQYKND